MIFDTRFKKRNISRILIKLISNDIKIDDINFNCISDYIIFIVYILKKLKKNNKELIKLINEYTKLINELQIKIPKQIFDQIILTNDINKLNSLKKFVKIK